MDNIGVTPCIHGPQGIVTLIRVCTNKVLYWLTHPQAPKDLDLYVYDYKCVFYVQNVYGTFIYGDISPVIGSWS